MTHLKANLTALAFAGAVLTAHAQYEPPLPPAPSPGPIDTWLATVGPEAKGWDVGVNERVRYEDKDSAGTTHAGSNFDFFSAPPSLNSNDYWLSRLMARIGYTGDWFAVMIEGRSSYSFGDDRYNATAAGTGLTDNDGPGQLEIASVAIGDLKRFPLLVKIGRQELVYGDQRLVGPAMWLNVPHTFDAAKVRYQVAGFGVDVFTAHPVYARGSHFDESNQQDTLSGVYADFPAVSADRATEAYLLARNVARGIVTDNWSLTPAPFRFPAPQDVYTLGFRTKTKPAAKTEFDWGIEAMYQFGDRTAVFAGTSVAAARVAPRLSQSAWAYVAQVGHTWRDVVGQPRLALIASGASGDHNATDSSSGTFQNMIPSNHGLYGIMDLTGLQNVQDLRLALSIKPTAALRLAVDLHQQYLTTTHDYWYNAAGVPRNTPGALAGSGRGFGINPTYGNDLGQEIDAIAGWSPIKGACAVEAGVAHFFAGTYVHESLAAVGSRDANYGYVQFTVNL